jgi:hypothetical protein
MKFAIAVGAAILSICALHSYLSLATDAAAAKQFFSHRPEFEELPKMSEEGTRIRR